MSSWLDFAQAMLAGLGAPDTHDNEAALLTWFAGEQPPGSPNAAFNPLNIQAGNFAHVGTSGSGQYDFGDWSSGVRETVQFLTANPAYASIVASLRDGAPAAQTLGAIQASPWAESHYGGRLTGLLSSILGSWSTYANGTIAGAPGGTTGTAAAGGATSAAATAAGANPIASALGSLLSPIFQSTTRLGLLIVGVGGAVALIVLGGYRAVQPAVHNATERAGEAGQAAAGASSKAGAAAPEAAAVAAA